MKSAIINLKFVLFSIILLTTFSCENNDDDQKTYTYDAKIDIFCNGLIYIETDNIKFVKPINLEKEYNQQDLQVKVSFYYTGKVDENCGGFVGQPKLIKITKIEKL